jgi:hypothetical protein
VKVIYRPQCGSLKDAMKQCKKFKTLLDCYNYIVKQHSSKECGVAFNPYDLSIRYYGYDSRIKWETFIVCTDRYFKEKYETPQCIGFLTFK